MQTKNDKLRNASPNYNKQQQQPGGGGGGNNGYNQNRGTPVNYNQSSSGGQSQNSSGGPNANVQFNQIRLQSEVLELIQTLSLDYDQMSPVEVRQQLRRLVTAE